MIPMQRGTESAGGLERKILGIAAAYLTMQSQKVLNLSDTMDPNNSKT